MIKQKDLYFIIVVVVVAAAISLVGTSMLFKISKVKTKVEEVQPITNNFPIPDVAYFNKNSIDPTQTIVIGNDQNTDPFKGNQP